MVAIAEEDVSFQCIPSFLLELELLEGLLNLEDSGFNWFILKNRQVKVGNVLIFLSGLNIFVYRALADGFNK